MLDTNAMRCLIVPGLGYTGPDHWQSRWQNMRDDCDSVALRAWAYRPHRSHWVAKLELAIAQQNEPVILVAHGLGCQAVAWWSVLAGTDRWPQIAGAMLVAPYDVEADGMTPAVQRFAPIPRCRLPFQTVVVASEDDPFCSLERAQYMAKRWGATFASVGALGHINAESNIQHWPEGQVILERLKQGEIGYSHKTVDLPMMSAGMLNAREQNVPGLWTR